MRTTVDYLRSFLVETDAGNEIPWDRLMPLIRPADLSLDPRAAGKIHTRPLAEHLVEILGLDHPDVITMVTRAESEPWEVLDRQLYEAARANLVRHEYQTSIEPIGASGQGAVLVVNPRGYELSWLVYPEIFTKPIGAVANPVHGLLRQLVFPVSRNEMFVLPEVEYLDLCSPQGRVVVPWVQAEAILRLEALPGWWPARWTPGAWPVDEPRWQALRSAQVDPAILEREARARLQP